MSRFLLVCGHTNIDVLLHLDAFPRPGESRPVHSRQTVYGGTACNIARHAAGLGVPTRLWSRVGTDLPPDWRRRLEEARLDLAFDEDHVLPTPTCYVLHDAHGEQAYCMDQGAMGTAGSHPPHASLLDDVEGWLHIATGDPLAWLDLVDHARSRGIRVAFDPGQEIHFAYDRQLFETLLDQSDVFWCNATELEVALGFLGYGGPEQLLDHVGRLVITRGAKGVEMHARGHKVHVCEARPTQVVDATGAGDALRSGTYAGLHQGRSWEDALVMGQAAARVSLGMQGPQERTLAPRDLA